MRVLEKQCTKCFMATFHLKTNIRDVRQEPLTTEMIRKVVDIMKGEVVYECPDCGDSWT